MKALRFNTEAIPLKAAAKVVRKELTKMIQLIIAGEQHRDEF